MTKTMPTKTKHYTGKTQPPVANSDAWRQEQLNEAIENLAYWKRRAAIAVNPVDKAACLARVAAWTSTRDARAENVLLLAR